MGIVGRNRRTASRLIRIQRLTAARAGLPRRALAHLAQPLDRSLISEREARDGRILQYIEGWAVINQANRLFGYDGWGAEVVGEVNFRPLSLTDTASDTPLAVAAYMATVRVTVRGCPARSDVGCGFVAADTPEAHEAAYKGAVTDALKRALRFFGDQFGNGLYDRRHTIDKPLPAAPAPPRPSKLDAMRGKVLEMSGKLGLAEAKARSQIKKQFSQPLDALDEQQLAEAIRSLADEFNRRNARPANRTAQRRAA